jgi:hypothetical protein
MRINVVTDDDVAGISRGKRASKEDKQDNNGKDDT